MEKDAILYEIGYLLKDSLEDEDVLSFSENLRNSITEKGGLITTEGKPKKQSLVYPIKKEVTTTFNWLKFLVKPIAIKEVKNYLEGHPSVLRFLIMKTETEKAPKKGTLKPKRLQVKKPAVVTMATPETTKSEIEMDELKEEEIDKKIEELLGGE